MLQLLVAEALGLFDGGALLGIGGEERRLWLQLAPARVAISREPCSLRPSIFSAGTVLPGKPRARRIPLDITGKRSVRL